MKKIILLLGFLFVFIFGYSQTYVLRPRIDADLFNGQLPTYYLDTTSTGQAKASSLDLTISNTTAGGETGLYSYTSHTTNALTGELIGVRGSARVNVNSSSGTVMGGKFQSGNMDAGYDLTTATGVYVDVVNKIPSGASVTWTNARGYEVSMDLNQGSSGHTNTVTNAQMFYGVYNLPTVGTYATVTNGYGMFLRNEAVGGTGQMLDAGFYLDDKSHTGGIKGWDYGIDFSGIGSNSGSFGTADFRFSNGATADNIQTDTLTFTETVIKTSGILHAFGSIKAKAGVNMLDQNLTWTNGGDIQNDDTDTLTLSETVVQVDGTFNLIEFKSPTNPVLTMGSTGDVDTLATDDIGDIAFTLSGGMAYVSTAGTQTIGTGGTFERLNEGAIAYTGAHLHDFTHDDGRLTYTGTNTKHFTIRVNFNIEGDEVAQLIALQLYKDGALIAATNDQHDYNVQDSDDSIGFAWLVEMATDEYVEVWGTSDTNADEFTLIGGSMVISQH